MIGKIHIRMLVLVLLARLLETSRFERHAVPNILVATALLLGKQSQPATILPVTPTPINKVCGLSKSEDKRWEQSGPAELGQFPWMAAIFEDKPLRIVLCGGALISEQYVLTAASCFIDWDTGLRRRNVSEYTVRFGDMDMATDNDNATTVDFKVAEVITHEKYNRTATGNDIALMKLEKAVQYSDVLLPICLPTPPKMAWDKYDGWKAIVAGWGRINSRTDFSQIQQFVTVDVITNPECDKRLFRFSGYMCDYQMCAVQYLGRKFVCHGDGGGPLMLYNFGTGRWYTIGVVSTVLECGDGPVVFTRTTAYLDWIMKNAQIDRNSTFKH